MINIKSNKIKAMLVRFAAGAGALAAVAGQAHAAGVTAGTDVDNTFVLTYDVNGVEQEQITNDPDAVVGFNGDAPAAFTVDRVINVDVTVNNTLNAAGQVEATTNQGVILSYTVTNLGNDNQAYDLDLIDTGDAFNLDPTDPASTVEVFIVSADPATGLLPANPTPDDGVLYAPNIGGIVATDDIAPDESFIVLVVGTVPVSQPDGDLADHILLATTLSPTASIPAIDVNGDGLGGQAADAQGAPGTVVEPPASAITNTVTGDAQNVFLDAAGDAAGDDAADGQASDTITVLVVAAELSASKTVAVLSDDPAGDGFTCASDATPSQAVQDTQFSIPGACVEYVIAVSNSGSAAATEIIIEDVLPAGVTFVGAFFVGAWDGTSADPDTVVPTLLEPAGTPVCDGTNTGANACVVGVDATGTTGALGAGLDASLIIRATITAS